MHTLYRIVLMGSDNKAYKAIDIPIPGTYILVPEAELGRFSEAVNLIKYLNIPPSETFTFGFLLKHHREAMDLSQEDLESLSGVGQKHISNIEKSITIPRWETFEKLFTHLDPKFEAGIKFIWEREKSIKNSA